MSLGGGVFISQNKKLPGAYINFVSAARASSSLSERGIVAMPLVMDWGVEGEVITVTSEDFQKNALNIFGYDYGHEKMKGLRDLFMNIRTLYTYRLIKSGVKASNELAEAKCAGIRGNDLKIAISANVDEPSKFDVSTILDYTVVDLQTVATVDELVANDWVTFKSVQLAETAAKPLTSGTNGSAVSTAEYQGFLDKIEAYSFNALGVPVKDETITSLIVSFTKRMRDEIGAKFQSVVYKKNTADYEGIVSVENKVNDDTNEASAVYWTTGIIAGCPVNQSNTNKSYNGEFDIDVNYTQAQLAEALEQGKFIFHKVANEVRVLEDINTFVSFIDGKGSDFSSNQTIRVIDQIANDVASLFNTKYLGKIPNNASGRVSLWSDIVAHHRELESVGAIEDFNSEDVIVDQGQTKKSVVLQDKVTPVNAMSQLYMTCVIA